MVLHRQQCGHQLDSVPEILQAEVFVEAVLIVVVIGDGDGDRRGVQDIFIACVDGLKGLPQAIETVIPRPFLLWAWRGEA